jgi:hypothetical protein
MFAIVLAIDTNSSARFQLFIIISLTYWLRDGMNCIVYTLQRCDKKGLDASASFERQGGGFFEATQDRTA